MEDDYQMDSTDDGLVAKLDSPLKDQIDTTIANLDGSPSLGSPMGLEGVVEGVVEIPDVVRTSVTPERTFENDMQLNSLRSQSVSSSGSLKTTEV